MPTFSQVLSIHEGYDNVKQKFVSSWVDNMSTRVMMSKGDYDPATETFTYASEYEAIPGMKTKIREVLKIVDNNHHTFEWYEDRGGPGSENDGDQPHAFFTQVLFASTSNPKKTGQCSPLRWV